MITMAGHVPDVDIPIVFTGLRPGEKLYEELLTEDEEKTRHVNDKIFVADCPSPPPDLGFRVEELAKAAALGEERRVIELLQSLVPSYRREAAEIAQSDGTAAEIA
jgi:FlaA1/EpsC-like NDP-sugar epimerase